MSTSKEATEFVCEYYDSTPSDWKRISKRKHEMCEVRQFQNKTTLEIVEVLNSPGSDDFFFTNRIPTKFWISLPGDIVEKLNNGLLDDSYISPIGEDYDSNTGYINGALIVGFQEIDGQPNSNIWYDQHISWIVENYHGVKNFLKEYDEPCENLNILLVKKSIKDVKNSLTSKGLKFLGYWVNNLE